MPLVIYSVLRLALFGACWAALAWAGLNPFVAVVVAAFAAWGLSYAGLPGPRDAAARWLADRAARRTAGAPTMSARAQRDAADEDALVEGRGDVEVPPDEPGPDPAQDPAPRG